MGPTRRQLSDGSKARNRREIAGRKKVQADNTKLSLGKSEAAAITSKQPACDNTERTAAGDVGQVYDALTGDALPTPPPSVVNVGSVAVSTTLSSDDHQSKLFFEACQRNGRMANEVMLSKDLSSYVRYELFPRLKFIMSNSQLNFSSEKTTICGLICADMGLLEPKAAVEWWEKYKGMIADVLNAKRADVTGAIKRVFMRK